MADDSMESAVIVVGDVEAERRPPTTAHRIPDSDVVALDSVRGGGFQLTHLVTFEHTILPRGEWVLELGEDGMCVLANESNADDEEGGLFDIDDYLKHVVYKVDGNNELLVRVGDSVPENLDVERCCYRECELRLPVGATTAASCLQLFAFKRLRSCRSKLYWNMSQFFITLKLETFKKMPSRWLDHCSSRWR
jgi:hypothetical protein